MAALLGLPLTAQALSIGVSATPLGGALWRYTYLLAGESFGADEGFTILFDYNLYGALSNPTAGTDWSALTVDPVSDPGTSTYSDGFFDALALVNAASFADPFSVDFEWLGAGTPPGSQPFEVYVCTSPGCATLESHPTIAGGTTGAIPLPGSLALTAAGLLGLGLGRGRPPRAVGGLAVQGASRPSTGEPQ